MTKMTISPIEKYFEKLTCYHYYFFALLYLSKIPVFWHVLSLIFLAPPMEYTCKGAEGGLNQCPCDEPVWNTSVFTQTVQTKFNLICEYMWLFSFSQSMLFTGTLFGALCFGFMSDKYGRLLSFTVSSLVISVAGILLVVMPTAPSFIVFRCIEGFGVGGSIVTSYVLLVEYCGKGYRELASALYHIPINISHMTLAGVSYFLRNCDHFMLALSIPTILCITLYCLTLESPKWLIDTENYAKATHVMQKIAKFNRDSPEVMKAEMDAYYEVSNRPKHTKLSFWQIFKHKKLTINLACMSVIYFSCGMGYYGVSQFIGKMSGNIHKNVAISGAVLVPGTLLSAYLLKKLGRKTFLMSTTFLSGVSMIIVICIPKRLLWARVGMACVCNCFFFMSFIVVFLYGVELFPTSIRNSVLGFLSVLSRVGQIAGPPINMLPQTVAGAIFGSMAIIGSLLCFPLPETKNMELPTTLEDTTALPRSNSI